MDTLSVYFHGVPGSPDELVALASCAGLHSGAFESWYAPQRNKISATFRGREYFQTLADEISHKAEGRPTAFVGFSLGSFVALQTSLQMLEPPKVIHLISPAAPLDAGDFLHLMAGREIFGLAIRHPKLLEIVVAIQGLLSQFAPGLLFELLFQSAQGSDRLLCRDPKFRRTVKQILRSAFSSGDGAREGYLREVGAYTIPWKHDIARIQVPRKLLQGELDNWTPSVMAAELSAQLPRSMGITTIAGASHYGALLHTQAILSSAPNERA